MTSGISKGLNYVFRCYFFGVIFVVTLYIMFIVYISVINVKNFKFYPEKSLNYNEYISERLIHDGHRIPLRFVIESSISSGLDSNSYVKKFTHKKETFPSLPRSAVAINPKKNFSLRYQPWNPCCKPSLRPEIGENTALASYPGSGNTWIRYLVQQITGYLTGSRYKDFSLFRHGFPAEGIQDGSVILVKTHEYGLSERRLFDKAILLIRNPFKALLAEFNRQSGSHIGHAPIIYYHKPGWKQFVLTEIERWSSHILDWIQYRGPLLVLRFEDVINDTSNKLLQIISFLELKTPEKQFLCTLENKVGIYKRPVKLLPFDPFAQIIGNSSLRQLVEKSRKKVYKIVNQYLANSSKN